MRKSSDASEKIHWLTSSKKYLMRTDPQIMGRT
jgi:hypothetical protein